MRNSLLPLAEPCRGTRCLCRSKPQFPSQYNQVVCNVDVVEWFGEAGGEFKNLRARQQLIERAPCSHAISFEKRRVSGFGSNQVVASIVGWPDDHVMRREYFERAVQNRRRKVGTVAIECDDVWPALGSEASKNRGESRRETFTFLCYDLHRTAQQACQFGVMRLRAHHRDLHARQRLCQREGVLQEAAIQCCHCGR